MLAVLLFFTGLTGGFLSGLLGIGGAVITIPLMLALPPLFGLPELSAKTAAALSMFQILAASVSGIIVHRKNRQFHAEAFAALSLPAAAAAFFASWFSHRLENGTVLLVFVTVIPAALLVFFFNKESLTAEYGRPLSVCEKTAAAAGGAFTGMLSGIAGVGGSFIFIPLMTAVLKLPLKTAIGTSLGAVFVTAVSGSAGKILSMQLDPLLALPLAAAAVFSSGLGASVNRLIKPELLKILLLAVLGGSFIIVLFEIIKNIQ
jgi:hypothetical protein